MVSFVQVHSGGKKSRSVCLPSQLWYVVTYTSALSHGVVGPPNSLPQHPGFSLALLLFPVPSALSRSILGPPNHLLCSPWPCGSCFSSTKSFFPSCPTLVFRAMFFLPHNTFCLLQPFMYTVNLFSPALPCAPSSHYPVLGT